MAKQIFRRGVHDLKTGQQNGHDHLRLNQVPAHQINETDETDEIDETDETNQTDQLNQTNQTDRIA